MIINNIVCGQYFSGALVVNIWGGLADVEKKRPWSKDMLSVFWSSTKGVSAIVVGHLVDRYSIVHTYRIQGERLLISSLPGKALRMLVDIARLAEQFNKHAQSQA